MVAPEIEEEISTRAPACSWCTFEMYALAEKLRLTQLMDQAMDLWINAGAKRSAVMEPQHLRGTYRVNSPNSAPRLYVSRMVCYLLFNIGAAQKTAFMGNRKDSKGHDRVS